MDPVKQRNYCSYRVYTSELVIPEVPLWRRLGEDILIQKTEATMPILVKWQQLVPLLRGAGVCSSCANLNQLLSHSCELAVEENSLP